MHGIILHIDMNSFFAACEQQANPLLRGKPIAVSGNPESRTIISAASKEAKIYGVTTGMTVYQAKKLCPHIQYIICDPDKYAYISSQLVALYCGYTELVEPFSIDECFLDVTEYYTKGVDPVSIAMEIKHRIRQEIGEWLTCSVGIAHNKLLAKLGSEINKPDGLTYIADNAHTHTKYAEILTVSQALKKISLTDMCGIGKGLEKQLRKQGIDNFSKLQEYTNKELISWFGKSLGNKLWMMARGMDDEPVKSIHHQSARKSMSHAITLQKATNNKQYVDAMILNLCVKLASRLKLHHLSGRTIGVHIRFFDFSGWESRRSFAQPTYDAWLLFQRAKTIAQDVYPYEKTVRMISVAVSNLATIQGETVALWKQAQKKSNALDAMHNINEKFGERTVLPLSTLHLETLPPDINGFSQSRG